MSDNDAVKSNKKRKPRRSTKPKTKTSTTSQAPTVDQVETKHVSPELKLVQDVEFDMTGSAWGPQVKIKPQVKTKDLLTKAEVADMKATLKAAAEGGPEIELVQVGLISQDSLDRLKLADKDSSLAFSGVETNVPLWHEGDPPSVAEIPVYVLPEVVAKYEKVQYQGYDDPDDIQAGSDQDEGVDMVDALTGRVEDTVEDETVAPTREDYERMVSSCHAEIKELASENSALKIRNQDLEWATYRPTWWEQTKAKIQDFFNPKTSLTYDDVRVRSKVWVINTAASSRYQLEGDIVIPYTQYNGVSVKDQMFKVPQTWLPKLIDEPARKLAINNPAFRRAINDCLLTFISDREARRLLALPEAKDEQFRLLSLDEHVRRAGAARTIADSAVTITNADGDGADEEY